MFDPILWAKGLAALALFAGAGWLLSLPLRNVSIVDSLWSLMFFLAASVYLMGQAEPGPRAWLVITLVALWAIRLAAYITWRNHGHGEDFPGSRSRASTSSSACRPDWRG
jgi:steroid 5-alpha reductase family enzyme